MPNYLRANREGTRALALLAAVLIVAQGCGLGMDSAARLERAKSAFAATEYRAAVIDAKNILQREPENREARLLLGRSSLRLNDMGTAEKELRRAVSLGTDLGLVAVDLGRAMLALRQHERLLDEIRPELAQSEDDRLAILRLRGDALLALARPSEARVAYQEVLAAASDDLPAMLGLASSYLAEGNLGQARATVDGALAIDASYLPARLASASLFLSAADHGAAEQEFEKAAELAAAGSEPMEEAAALSGLVDAQLAARDVAAAKETLARLEQLAPDNLSTLYLKARIAFLEEDYELAQDVLQRVLAAAPDSGPAQFLMGAVQLQRGNLGQAEMHLSSVVAHSPQNADARKLLAEVRLRQDRADEAADLLRPLLQGEGADVGALNLAVRASLEAGEVTDAIGYLRRAQASDPENAGIRLDLAAAYLAAGEVEEAEALLAQEGGGDENAYRLALLKVMAPLRRGDATTAMDEATGMAARWPDDARVRNLIGGIALSLDDPERARRSFLEARDLDPDDLTAYLNLARIDIGDGDYDAARGHYEAALERRPSASSLMVAMAQLEARAGDAESAVEWLEKARGAAPDALAPRLLLARYYVAEREYAAAETAAAEAVALDASNAEAHNLLGLARQGRGEMAAAVESFAEAGRLEPEKADYRMNKARAEAALGDAERAERTLIGSGELDLDDLQSAVLVAGLKVRQGDRDAALQIARDLQARHPDEAIPFALEGELLAGEEQYARADAVYRKALALGGDDPRIVLRAYRVRNNGRLEAPEEPLLDYLEKHPRDVDVRVIAAQHYQGRGESERAIAEYEQVLAVDSDHFVALNNLAWEYFITGDPRAEDTARRAFERSPDNGAVVDTLGWIQVSKGNLEEGIANLRKAVELTGGSSEVRYHLAAGLAAAGESEEARRLLEELLAAADGFPARGEAERLLDTL